MKTSFGILIGILIGASTLGLVWAATDGDVTVRILGIRHDDGRVEVGLQRQDDGEWIDVETPELRYVPVDAEIGRQLHSSPIVLPVTEPSEQVAQDYSDYLRDSGASVAASFSGYFERSADGATPLLLCLVDHEDEGIEALCEGMEANYAGTIEQVEAGSYAELQGLLETRFSAEPTDEQEAVGGFFATSLETVEAAIRAEDASGNNLPGSYWIELVDQHLSDPEALFCVISHGGPPAEVDLDFLSDLFWGLASESAESAAGALNLNLRTAAYGDHAQQAEGVRECIADGAAAIAITLSDPDTLQPVVAEANEAGIPILSFNSGGSVASEVGTALHFGLDDRRAGELAGEEFNEHGVEGNVLCILHETKNIGLEERCDGLAATYNGEVERWYASSLLDLPGELADRLEAGGVNGVLTLSIDSTFDTWWIIRRLDLDLPHGGFGFGVGTAHRVADGEIMFTIVDHPEIQAYAAVTLAHMLDRFRIDPSVYFGGAAIQIQPLVLGAEEAQEMLNGLVAD